MTLIYRGFTQALCPDCCARMGDADDCGTCEGTGRERVAANVLTDAAPLLRGLDRLSWDIHRDNVKAGWWTDLASGADLLETRNRGEMLLLAITELSEAEEAHAFGKMDDKLPHRMGLHVELADCAIRLLDTLGAEQRRMGGHGLVTWWIGKGSFTVARCRNEFVENLDSLTCPAGDLMRIVRDLSAAFDEGYRKGNVRLACFWMTVALLRIIAWCDLQEVALFEIVAEKRAYNRNRADHKPENRRQKGGKLC